MAKWVELKKKVNGQTYTGIKLSGLKSHWRPCIILGEWQPIFFIESKLFHSFTDWAHFFNSIFAAICRITKSAVYLNTPLGFEFQTSKHLFVVPCHANPHLRGVRGRKFENIRPDSRSVTPKTPENVKLYSSVFIFLQSTPTPKPTILIHEGDGSENF